MSAMICSGNTKIYTKKEDFIDPGAGYSSPQRMKYMDGSCEFAKSFTCEIQDGGHRTAPKVEIKIFFFYIFFIFK